MHLLYLDMRDSLFIVYLYHIVGVYILHLFLFSTPKISTYACSKMNVFSLYYVDIDIALASGFKDQAFDIYSIPQGELDHR